MTEPTSIVPLSNNYPISFGQYEIYLACLIESSYNSATRRILMRYAALDMSNDFTPTVRTIVDTLRSQIVGGTYPVGTPLPAETEIAAALQVGRGSVRRGH